MHFLRGARSSRIHHNFHMTDGRETIASSLWDSVLLLGRDKITEEVSALGGKPLTVIVNVGAHFVIRSKYFKDYKKRLEKKFELLEEILPQVGTDYI